MEDVEIARLAAVIDHTRLAPATAAADIRRLCCEAAEHRFATVCVNPVWVNTAVRHLEGTGVGVCTVIGFPLGATPTDVKRYETARAISDGAREVDMVINLGWLKGGDFTAAGSDIAEVARAARGDGALTKVIIEAALLTDDEKVTACDLARDAGADFVKTSTGFGPGGATVADVVLMRRAVGATLGVKAAGGIRDIGTLQALLMAGATRIGTSAGVEILLSARETQAQCGGSSPNSEGA